MKEQKQLDKEVDKDMNKLESEYPLPTIGFKIAFKNKRRPFAEELIDSLKKKVNSGNGT